jgi:CDP-glucose 4,6-dehydratase
MRSHIDRFNNFYAGKRVLITGHTGFKGSWLSIWLHELGAEVVGVGLEPYSEKDNFVLSGIGNRIYADLRADIRDAQAMQRIFEQYQPDIVFHLAAQPLVRYSYDEPVMTWETNVMGTIHVMEAFRHCPSAKVAVMITTDKCYENRETNHAYTEEEPMGGYDPYSSSKGADEIAISSWRRSFMNPAEYAKHGKSIASVRAGNVIGGGDWAKDRIIPDCIRAIETNEPIKIRNRHAVRPWQHVLEPLRGYMMLAQKMWESPTEYCEGWNFGPKKDVVVPVWDVANDLVKLYGKGLLIDQTDPNAAHEANLLMLDSSKAFTRLNWCPYLRTRESIALTVDWYKRYRDKDVYELCVDEIKMFLKIGEELSK